MSPTSKHFEIYLDFDSPRGNLRAGFGNSLFSVFMYVNNHPWDAVWLLNDLRFSQIQAPTEPSIFSS